MTSMARLIIDFIRGGMLAKVTIRAGLEEDEAGTAAKERGGEQGARSGRGSGRVGGGNGWRTVDVDEAREHAEPGHLHLGRA